MLELGALPRGSPGEGISLQPQITSAFHAQSRNARLGRWARVDSRFILPRLLEWLEHVY